MKKTIVMLLLFAVAAVGQQTQQTPKISNADLKWPTQPMPALGSYGLGFGMQPPNPQSSYDCVHMLADNIPGVTANKDFTPDSLVYTEASLTNKNTTLIYTSKGVFTLEGGSCKKTDKSSDVYAKLASKVGGMGLIQSNSTMNLQHQLDSLQHQIKSADPATMSYGTAAADVDQLKQQLSTSQSQDMLIAATIQSQCSSADNADLRRVSMAIGRGAQTNDGKNSGSK